MNDAQRAELKQRMRDEIDALRRLSADLREQTGPVAPDVAIGRLSRLDTMLNQGVNKASLAKSTARIRNLEAALLRIDQDPDFGECAGCGEPIPLARLLALPETEYCVECAE